VAAWPGHCRDDGRERAHGLSHGLIGAAVGAWAAVALVGLYELLMMIIRSEQVPAITPGAHDDGSAIDPLKKHAAAVFAADLAADTIAERHGENLAA
jgi:hypothetical protein